MRPAGRGPSPWLAAGLLPTALYVLFIGVPFVALFVRAVAEGGLGAQLGDPFVLQALRLSLLTSAVAVGVVILLGTPFAYLLARSDFPGRRLLDATIELPLVLPPVVAGVALLMAFGRQGLLGQWLEGIGISLPFTSAAVVLAQIFVAAPFYLRAARLGFQNVDVSLEHIAQTLGEPPWRTFFRVSLPLAAPSLLGGVVLCWARALSEFGATIMFAGNLTGRTQTMPLAILTAMERDLGESLALSVLLALLAMGILLALALLPGLRLRREAP
ncbi:MAG: ABC transporter permease [Dehalococcoidia bacterium]